NFLVFAFLPLSISIALLRYRLWDVDIVIRRTLAYGTLTVILLASYLTLVLVGQFLLASLLHSNNAVVLVISTLITAALFQLLRQRFQQLVDRRFYRSKYDAAKVVADFSARLHQEVDLTHLSEQLLSVVQQTMQPTSLSLWICQVKPQKLREDL